MDLEKFKRLADEHRKLKRKLGDIERELEDSQDVLSDLINETVRNYLDAGFTFGWWSTPKCIEFESLNDRYLEVKKNWRDGAFSYGEIPISFILDPEQFEAEIEAAIAFRRDKDAKREALAQDHRREQYEQLKKEFENE